MEESTALDVSNGDKKQDPKIYEDIFDKEFKNVLQEKQLSLQAKSISLQQSVVVTIILFVLYLACGYFFYKTEDSTVLDTPSTISPDGGWDFMWIMHFMIDTATTVGYEAGPPLTQRSRLFTTIIIVIGMTLIAVVFSESFQYIHLLAQKAQYSRDEVELAQRTMKRLGSSGLAKSEGDESMHRLSEIIKNDNETGKVFHTLMSKFVGMKNYCNYTHCGQYLKLIVPIVFLLFIGTVCVGPVEGWSVLDCFYFAVVTMSSVGYGDIGPTLRPTIWFTTFYMLFSDFWIFLLLALVDKAFGDFHKWNISRIKANMKGPEIVTKSTSTNGLEKELPNGSVQIDIINEHDTNTGDAGGVGAGAVVKSIHLSVMKRILFIVVQEIAKGNFKQTVEGNRLTVNCSTLHVSAEKWLIPTSAKKSFKEVSLRIMMFIGSRGMISKSMDEIFALVLKELTFTFSPLLAEMGSESTLETWLKSTDHMAQL